MTEPDLSVIVVAKTKSLSVDYCISSVERSANLSVPDLDVEVLFSDLPNKSKARNELAKKARGPILVFIDSDAVASDFWLHELIKPFCDPGVAAVGGAQLVKDEAGYRELLADKILGFPLATFKSSSRYKVSGPIRDVDESEITSCTLAIRTTWFNRAGHFPEDFIPCEENVLLERIQLLGGRLVYNPLAIVFHNRDPLFRAYARKIFSYAKGRGRMIRRGKGSLRLFPRPSKDFIFLGFGLVIHYLAYVSGLIWGWLKG